MSNTAHWKALSVASQSTLSSRRVIVKSNSGSCWIQLRWTGVFPLCPLVQTSFPDYALLFQILYLIIFSIIPAFLCPISHSHIISKLYWGIFKLRYLRSRHPSKTSILMWQIVLWFQKEKKRGGKGGGKKHAHQTKQLVFLHYAQLRGLERSISLATHS